MNKRNENRPGYRKTQVGWIPGEWKCVPFGELVYASQYGLSQSVSEDGNAQIIGMSNLQDGKIILKKVQKVKILNDEFEKFRIKKNDLLFNRTNSLALVGKTALAEADMQCVFASYIVRFLLNDSLVHPSFLAYYFNQNDAITRLKALATTGASQYNINPTTLQKYFNIPRPHLPEQKKIAKILSAWDRAIEQMGKLIDSKQKLKKGLMQQLLTGKRRFKEFVKTSKKQNTRYGLIPVDWDYPKVGENAEVVSNRNTDGKNISVLSCTKYDGLVESLKYFGRQVFSKDTSTYKVVKRGQFAYATNHIEEGSIGILDFLDEGLVSPMYTVFKTGKGINALFLYKVFKTELYRHVFEINTSASINRRGSLRWNRFTLIHVPLPSLDEQKKISDCIDYIDREIGLLKNKLEKLKQQKKGLMQKLLTGETRVKV